MSDDRDERLPREDLMLRIELNQRPDGWWEWVADGLTMGRKHPTRRAAWKAAKSFLIVRDRKRQKRLDASAHQG